VNQNRLFRPLLVICALAVQFLALSCHGAGYPDLANGDWICPQFKFASGAQLENLRIHYRTTGRPEKNSRNVVTNAVLVLHGTTGSGAQFVRPEFAGQLFGPGQLLDSNRFYVVLPDGIGHGQSSRPSEQLHNKFPKYGYLDMVEAQRRLLTEGLGVNHLRLVMGTSMGGMHTWLWGEIHPEFMDALLPLASLPTQISGRNRVWRRMIIDSIRNDPGWQDGEYSAQPRGLRTALEVLYFMGSNPLQRYKEAPTLKQADELLDAYVAGQLKTADANNILYAVQASHDYEPNTNLEKIKAPLVAINFADDLINPPELGILEKEIQRVPNGKAIVVPMTDQTRGHGTHTLAAVWKRHLADLLNAAKLPPE
jgi:homoserine O-acetyltransferase/O-succinyltransferase